MHKLMTLDPRLRIAARRAIRSQAAGAGDHKGTRFPCFDGLRAIAALLVVGVHTSFESGFTTRSRSFGEYTSRLEIGVEVFFVISGFLLYRPFVTAHMSERPEPDRRQFWIRRLKRIIPAYWVAFLVATYVLRADSAGHTWYGLLVYLGFAQIYDPHYILHGIGQAWSLDVEMTFYLMVPFYAAVIGSSRKAASVRTRRHPRSQLRVELLGLAALTAISFAWRIPVLALDGPHANGIITTMPNWLPAFLDEFALGMLLAVGSCYLQATGGRVRLLEHWAMPGVCWSLALLSLFTVSHIGLSRLPIGYDSLGPSLARQALYGAFAILLVTPAVFGPQGRGVVRGFLRWRPMVGLGVVSYGIYLWHEAWMHMWFVWTGDRLFGFHWFGFFAFVTALAVVSATISYWGVERPVMRSRWGSAVSPESRPAVAKPGGATEPTGLSPASTATA